MDALALESVSHRYGDILAVDSVELAVRPNELGCLVGPSGCGKTTLLRVAAGLEPLQRGRILSDGAVVAGDGRSVPPEGRGVGFVFQDYALFPHLNVIDNVAFGLDRLPPRERRDRAATTLERLGMARQARAYPHELSGGQQQRVALARALAPRPRVMLLDEPFSGLDTRLRNQVREEAVQVLKESGAATLMVTHDPEEAMFMADWVAVMRDGRIEQVGAPAELYFQPASSFVAGFFGEVNRIVGRVEGGHVRTPLGDVSANGHAEGTAVDVLIRPEALKVRPASEGEPDCTGKVERARLLGRTSLVRVAVNTEDRALYLNARVPGRYLPRRNVTVALHLEPALTFVFPAESAT
ncbi:MAG: ABC transporter ATP-binding protein [Alphaproteobacteria bacterium]